QYAWIDGGQRARDEREKERAHAFSVSERGFERFADLVAARVEDDAGDFASVLEDKDRGAARHLMRLLKSGFLVIVNPHRLNPGKAGILEQLVQQNFLTSAGRTPARMDMRDDRCAGADERIEFHLVVRSKARKGESGNR